MNPIEKAIKKAGGRQVHLADLINVKKATVNSWVRGRNKVSLKSAKKIEEKTGVSRKELRPDLFD